MNISELVAIAMHTHAGVFCCQPPDLFVKENAARRWRKFGGFSPTLRTG